MGFSKEVRTQAVIDAARHCCVCHRYRGVKVEVHHIISRNNGGSDSAENAIALCFDCHADAGHYNPEHPRGTKFSPEELRLARDLWHLTVKHHQVEVPQQDSLYCRYLVCKSFSALAEIARGDLSNVPAESIRLAKTLAGSFLASIISHHPEQYRRSYVIGRSYSSIEEYREAHPKVRLFEDRDAVRAYPYFKAIRIPTRSELIERVANEDIITSILLDANVPEGEIAEAVMYFEPCGRGGYQEFYRIRPLWGIFLAATNITQGLLRVNSLRCEIELPDSVGYRALTAREQTEYQEYKLPCTPLPSQATILVPLMAVLGPLGIDDAPEPYRSEFRQVQGGEVQQTDHINGVDTERTLELIGPSYWPAGFSIRVNGDLDFNQIHQLDFTNLYIINRFWEMGSCPHLFFEKIDTCVSYYGEIWSYEPRRLQYASVVIPDSVHAIILAELEAETAHLNKIIVNGKTVVLQRALRTGSWVRISVKPNDRVTLVGSYWPKVSDQPADPWRKNLIVKDFIDDQERDRVGAKISPIMSMDSGAPGPLSG